jgi:uncharacterized protein YcbK (DUF882 family)
MESGPLNLRRTPPLSTDSSRFVRRALAVVGVSALALVALCPVAGARSPRVHMRSRVRLHPRPALMHAALLEPGILPLDDGTVPEEGAKYSLKLRHLHSGETIDVVYRIGDTYIPEAIDQLNYFLRDSRTQDEKAYDPSEFDLLHNVLAKLGRPKSEIDIVCGYRTPWSNEFLRDQGPDTGVAEHSQHMLAKAIDIRVPGVGTRRLRDAALSLDAGGVGYYPRSQFVHVDVGPVRQWSFSGGSGARRGRHKRRVRT